MTNLLHTSLPVLTTGDVWDLYAVSMGGSVRVREGKLSGDGRQTFGTSLQMMVVRDEEQTVVKGNSLHTLDPNFRPGFGIRYKASGKLWVQPFEMNGRVALSIVAEKFVPVGGDGK